MINKLTFIPFLILSIWFSSANAQNLTTENNSGGMSQEFVEKTPINDTQILEEGVFYEKKESDPLQKNKYLKNIEQLDKAIKNNVNNTNAYYKRAAAKANLGQYKEAIKDYSSVIKQKKGDSKSYLHRGKNYYELKDYAQAIDDYETAIALNIKEVFSDKDYINYRKEALNIILEANKAALDANKILFFWINEADVESTSNKHFVNEPYFPIKLKLISEQRLKNTDFSVYVNGKLLTGTLEEGRLMSMDKVYTFKKMVKLEGGENIVEVEVNGQRSAPLDISYQAQKPKLYVLSASTSNNKLIEVFDNQGDRSNGTLFSTVLATQIDAKQNNEKQILETLNQFSKDSQNDGFTKNNILILHLNSKVFDNEDAPQKIADLLNQMPFQKLLFVENVDSKNQLIEELSNKAESLITTTTNVISEDLGQLITAALAGAEADRDQNKIITNNELINYIKVQVPDSQVFHQNSEDTDIYLVK